MSVREGSDPEGSGLRARTESSSRTILLEGELDLASQDVLPEAVGLLAGGGGPITLNLEKLEFMDSSGLRAVIVAARQADVLILRSPRGQVHQLLRLCDIERLENVRLEDVPDE